MSLQKTLKKYVYFFIALSIIGLGVNLLAESMLGGDGITVLYMGLKHSFGLSYGASAYVYNFTIIGLAVVFARKYVGFGTFLYSFGIGSFVYFFESLLYRFDLYPEMLIEKILYLILGQVLLAFGLAVIINLKIGINALDCIIIKIQNKWGISYRVQRVIFDVSITLAGFLMGGLVGVGTIFSVLTLGILIQYFSLMIHKTITPNM